GSGKSSYTYEVGANFQKKYPEGQVVIIDPETSVDYVRLKYTFGYDLNRVHPVPAITIEDGFATITDICQGRFNFNAKENTKDIPNKSAVEKYTDRPFTRLLKESGITSAWMVSKVDEDKKVDIDELVRLGLVRDDKAYKIPPTFIVWDSIAASKPKLEVDAILGASSEDIESGKVKTANAGG